MHIEFLVEDSSGKRLLHQIVPAILGPIGEPHSWRIHSYRGVGRLPKDLNSKTDPAKRALLNNLPQLISGIGRNPSVHAIVIVVDTDRRDCRQFLVELNDLAARCNPRPSVMFRLAIEEMEAWLLGDQCAVSAAYPAANLSVLQAYKQDSVCGTWETLANAIYPSGATAIQKLGFPVSGDAKHEWAEKIGPNMRLDKNKSPSFNKFVEGLRRLTAAG